MKKLFLLLILNSAFLILNSFCSAQNKTTDSLLILIASDKGDTNQVNHLNKLTLEYISIGEYDIGLKYGNKALALAGSLKIGNKRGWFKGIASAFNNIGTVYNQQGNYSAALKNRFASLKLNEEIGDKHGIALSYNNIGVVYWNQGNYSDALKNYLASLKVREEIGDKKGIASSYNNIGIIYDSRGNYPEALKNHFASLKIREEVGDKHGIATSYNNIGVIYGFQKNYSEALKNYLASLKIKEEIGDKKGVANIYGNIGSIYQYQGNYSDALKNHLASLKIREEIKDRKGIATSFNNIGTIYNLQNNYPEALKNYFASLKIRENIGDKSGIIISFLNLGEVQTKLHKLKEARTYLNNALALSSEIGSIEKIKVSYEGLVTLDSMQGNWKAAYENHKLYIIYKDSIDNEETKKKTIESSMNYQFDIKEASIRAEQDKKDTIAEANKKRQLLILILVSFVLILVFAFAGLIFRSLRVTRKQKLIIEEKNKLVEEKNKDIIDSIRYAKRIQDALLREEEHVSMHLPEHFILFMPKDIVSGDFYWGTEKQEYWYFAVVDCTGHGVPGAVMSMLGISFLNDIVAQELLNPAEILNRLRDRVVKELRQTGETGGSKDGMDISLARLNLKTFELQWAGANNSLNLIQNGLLGIVKADKQPIGYHPKNQPFTNHEIQLQKGDSIYLYSDGYADQFGGPRGKKLKYKQLDDLIISHKLLKMKDQKELFKKCFIEWKGLLEQVDDVCVFGVRI